MFLAIFVTAALCGSFISLRLGLPKINVITVFTAIWVPLVIISSVEGVLSPGMSEGSWKVLILGLFGMIVGTLIAGGEVHPRIAYVEVNFKALFRTHFFFTVLLVLYILLQVRLSSFRSGISLSDVFLGSDNSGHEYRVSFFDAQELADSTTFDDATLSRGILSFVFFLGNVSIFTGAYLWVLRRRVAAVLPLLLSTVFSVLTLQRATLFIAATLFIFAVLALKITLRDPKSNSEGPKRKIRGVAFLSVALLAFGITRYAQSIRTRGSDRLATVSTDLQYFFSGLGGLNARDDTDRLGSVSFAFDSATLDATPGSNTFTDFFNILRRLELPVTSPPTHHSYVKVDILGYLFGTNVETMFSHFWLDFGLPGVFLISAAVALLGTITQRLSWQGHLKAVPLYSFTMMAISWAFIANYFGNLRYFLVAILATAVTARLTGQPSSDASEQADVEVTGLVDDRHPDDIDRDLTVVT